MTQSSLTIQPVTSKKHWKDFFKLRRLIYANDPAAVFPLAKMEWAQVDVKNNPFYKHARLAAFVCYQNGKPVGRIAAIKDDLHNEFNRDSVGFFGFFEAIDDQAVVKLLIDSAAQWLQEQGCESMRGPVNPSMKSDFGVLTDGHQFPPCIMMGHSPVRYDQHLIDEDFSVAKTFFAFEFRPETTDEETRAKWVNMTEAKEKIYKRYPKLNFRPVNAKNYEATLREINTLGNRVRAEGWGFVPLTEEELCFMIKNLRQVIRFDMIHTAYWDDKMIGYIVNIPDVNWALKKAVGRWDWLRMIQLPWLIRRSPKTRVIALGVDPDYRTKGVALMLIKQLIDIVFTYRSWEMSWVLEDNLKSMRAINRALPLDKYKTYRLYEKNL